MILPRVCARCAVAFPQRAMGRKRQAADRRVQERQEAVRRQRGAAEAKFPLGDY